MASNEEVAELAFEFLLAGDFARAEQLYQGILRDDPGHADSHHLLGVIAYQSGRYEEAVERIRHALSLSPSAGIYHTNLGLSLEALGQIENAVAHHERALLLRGPDADAHYNLGTALLRNKKLPEAEVQLRNAVRLRPEHAEAHGNLGLALVDQGKREEAIRHYREAVRLKPDYAEAHNNLGFALSELGQESLASFYRALRLQPDYADAHNNLALALGEHGKMSEAELHFQEALRLLPTPRKRLMLATLLPPIYQSIEDVSDWRRRLQKNIAALLKEGLHIDVTDDAALQSFFPAYQGLNDCELQRDLAQLYVPPAEPICEAPPVSPSRKIRIGFISHFFKKHTIGMLMRGLIAQFSRDKFAVTVLSLGNQTDDTAQWIRGHADEYVELSSRVSVARQAIAEQRLDVLYYADIGMEPITYTLAMSRLAPVQCVTWGHPVTTGIPTVDFFISNEALETPESDQHYSEHLVRLKNLAVYYYRPEAPKQLKDRKHFGLPSRGTLYVCPQSLFKLHPDFDEILAGILRRDTGGTLVFLQGRHPYWEKLLRERFVVTMPDVLGRVHFIPQQNHDDFMMLNALADVLLDPVHFGGGNTSYEAFSLGVPIVTLPSQFLRGRITHALYEQMGMRDCVVSSPAEYIDLAVKLASDRDYRASVSGKILATCDVLFENLTGVRELEVFLQNAVAQTWNRV